MEHSIYEASFEDYEKLIPLHNEVHNLHVQNRPDKYKKVTNSLDQKYFKEIIDSKEAVIYLIQSDYNEIIAYTILRNNKILSPENFAQNSYVFMEDFGVNRKFRRKGIGKLLFQKSINFAREVGAKSLELGVWEFNEEAIKFYESLGMATQSRKMELKIDR